MPEDRFQQINVGDEAEIFHEITAKDVDSFAELTGDTNPLHVDDNYASTTSFKKTVVLANIGNAYRYFGKKTLIFFKKSSFLTKINTFHWRDRPLPSSRSQIAPVAISSVKLILPVWLGFYCP